MGVIPTSRGGAVWRFVLAAVIVITFSATITAVAGLLQFKQIAKYVAATPAIKHARVVVPTPGNPQTILILGSDHRAGEPQRDANTDTIMLVRLDASSSTINVMSVPRDLMVYIPLADGGEETGKVNAAYSLGGPNLVVKTLQENVFPELQVNHIVDINFAGFEDLVDAIGCVYTQVDHFYYNDTAVTDYSSIDVEPGYQKLCGVAALSYVRFRHTDNDLVREARQQDFIRDAKAQYGQGNLIKHRNKLLKIFGEHTQTDPNLHTIDGLINLFNLVAFSDGHAIKQIPFPTTNIDDKVGNADYVTANENAEFSAFNEFMTPTVSASSATTTTATTTTPAEPSPAPTAGLTPDLSEGKLQGAALGDAGIPVYAPKLIAAGSEYCSSELGNCPTGSPISELGSYPRKYVIRTPQDHPEAAYQMTLVLNLTLGQYYDVEGMTWKNPPALVDPTESRVVGGKRLDLYFEGAKLDLVAWRTARGVYWISNTLTDNLDKQQMIGLAASLVRVP
jgi:polyisoprenyl-teichoic acid--peptidoglycan teichoic acid transferase